MMMIMMMDMIRQNGKFASQHNLEEQCSLDMSLVLVRSLLVGYFHICISDCSIVKCVECVLNFE